MHLDTSRGERERNYAGKPSQGTIGPCRLAEHSVVVVSDDSDSASDDPPPFYPYVFIVLAPLPLLPFVLLARPLPLLALWQSRASAPLICPRLVPASVPSLYPRLHAMHPLPPFSRYHTCFSRRNGAGRGAAPRVDGTGERAYSCETSGCSRSERQWRGGKEREANMDDSFLLPHSVHLSYFLLSAAGGALCAQYLNRIHGRMQRNAQYWFVLGLQQHRSMFVPQGHCRDGGRGQSDVSPTLPSTHIAVPDMRLCACLPVIP